MLVGKFVAPAPCLLEAAILLQLLLHEYIEASIVGYPDLLIVPSFALTGFLMTPLSYAIILGVAGASVLFAFALDEVKLRIFAALDMQ